MNTLRSDWRDSVIDDATPPVQVRRFHVDLSSKAFTVLVRFPAGWERRHAGHYLVDEEVLFLEGSFEMSGVQYSAGSYAYFPAGYLREASRSTGGALALAWFSGRQGWSRGPSLDLVPAGVVVDDWRAEPRMPVPIGGGGSGYRLRRDTSGDSWIIEYSPSGRSPLGASLELFSLAARTYAYVGPGDEIPRMEAPLFCRFRNEGR
jgi:hypothetical protein